MPNFIYGVGFANLRTLFNPQTPTIPPLPNILARQLSQIRARKDVSLAVSRTTGVLQFFALKHGFGHFERFCSLAIKPDIALVTGFAAKAIRS